MIRTARLRQMAYGMWLDQWHCSLDIIPKHWHPLQRPFLSSLYDRPHLCVLSPVILSPLTKDHGWYYPLSLLVIIHSNRARRCHFRCSRCHLSVHSMFDPGGCLWLQLLYLVQRTFYVSNTHQGFSTLCSAFFHSKASMLFATFNSVILYQIAQ